MEQKKMIFIIPNVGMVTATEGRSSEMPIVTFFEDGSTCEGQPRSYREIRSLGYTSIADGNFIHEALHLFVAVKCGFLKESVLYRAAHGCKFEGHCFIDACDEEQLVIGLQIAVNRSLAEEKVSGFQYHIAAAAEKFARSQFMERFGLDLDVLVNEFCNQLDSAPTGELVQLIENLEIASELIHDTQRDLRFQEDDLHTEYVGGLVTKIDTANMLYTLNGGISSARANLESIHREKLGRD